MPVTRINHKKLIDVGGLRTQEKETPPAVLKEHHVNDTQRLPLSLAMANVEVSWYAVKTPRRRMPLVFDCLPMGRFVQTPEI